MTKKELSEEIQKYISTYESNEPFEVKRGALIKTIELCRKYKEIFKVEYKHRFYGNRINFSEPLLCELEKLTCLK